MTNAIRFLATSIGWLVLSTTVSGQDASTHGKEWEKALTALKSICHVAPNIWTSASGDVNGDGIDDLALVVTQCWKAGQQDTGRGERLVMLLGTRENGYTTLSVSDKFCEVRWFYNLDIRKGSLFVQGITTLNASTSTNFKLQFQYNKRLDDLQLIGSEYLEESFKPMGYYRVSANYLTQTAVHTRNTGEQHKEIRVKLASSRQPIRMQGFDCSMYDSSHAAVYIDENLTVSNQSNAPRAK